MDARGTRSPVAEAQAGPRQKRAKLRDAEATRAEIVEAALQEFAEKGLHGARVEEIAARTATSKHMIYYYFGSKDGLYAAVLDRAYNDFRSAEAEIDYAALDPAAALAALVGATFDTHARNPHIVRVIMSENMDGGRHVGSLDHAWRRELVIGTLRGILARGVASGLFRDDIDPLQIHLCVSAMSFYGVANRFTFSAVFGVDMDTDESRQRRRAEVIETILSRCLRRGTAPAA